MSKGLNIRIYRIDRSHSQLERMVANDIPSRIIDLYNEEKQEITYEPLSQNNILSLGANQIHFFKKKFSSNSIPHAWKRFFESDNHEVAFGNMLTSNQHIVGFVLPENEEGNVYVISTGSAYVIFERFVDYGFPLEIAKRIVKPEIKRAETKGLAGALQASSLQFRRPRRISLIEGRGSIWTEVSGFVRDEILTKSDFKEIFGDKSKVGVTIKGSVSVGAKLKTPEKILEYIKWLSKVCEIYPIPSEEDFAFLDAVKKIDRKKSRELVENLDNELVKKLNEEPNSFELSHSESSLYLNSDSFIAKYGNQRTQYDVNPDIDELKKSFDANFDRVNIEKIRIEGQYSTEEYQNRGGTLKDLLCGELKFGEENYFLFNNHWFNLSFHFLSEISKDFNSIFKTGHIIGLNFPAWEKITNSQGRLAYNEGKYNELVCQRNDNSILGDKIFYQNVELFDILIWDEENVYIIHNKSGFNVNIRDVASQIFNSAQIIEASSSAGLSDLDVYYERLSNANRTDLSKEDFYKIIKKKRHYVLGYGKHTEVTNSSDTSSSVAKLEIVQLRNDMLRFQVNQHPLKINWIKQI